MLVVSLLFLFCSDKKLDISDSDNLKTDNVAATTKELVRTYTGLKPLEEIKFKVNDPDNSRGLSTEKVSHSYGVAAGERPHSISVESQSFFEKRNYNAVTLDTRSGKVLYLTFDCGYENGYTAKILDILKEKNIKAAFFCTLDEIKSEPELIARMIKEGHIVGNHSTTHPSFAHISRAKMAQELEMCENYLRQHFGYSSKFFRFPKGEYSESALDLIGNLGYVSVFWSLAYADWDTAEQKGWQYAYDKVTSRLHPGAVILLHSVSPDNCYALDKIIDYASENGYRFASLEELNLSYTH